MIAPEKLTKEKLSKVLIRKHGNFLKQYKKEFELLSKIKILKDKEEQLEHWLNSAKNPSEEKKYIKELQKADDELLKLDEKLDEIENLDSSPSLKNRYNSLKNQIQLEEEAFNYWKEKSKEFRLEE